MNNREKKASHEAIAFKAESEERMMKPVHIPKPTILLERVFWDAPIELQEKWREIRERDFNLSPVLEQFIPDRIEGHRLRQEDKLRLLTEPYNPDEECGFYYYLDKRGFLRKTDTFPEPEEKGSYVLLKDVDYPKYVPQYRFMTDAELRGMARAANSYFDRISYGHAEYLTRLGLGEMDYLTKNGMQTLMAVHLHRDDPEKISAISAYLSLMENRPKRPRMPPYLRNNDRYDSDLKTYIAADRLYRPEVIQQEDRLKEMDIFPASLLYLDKLVFLKTVSHIYDIRAQYRQLTENRQLLPVTVQPLRGNNSIENKNGLLFFSTQQLQSVPTKIDGYPIDEQQFLTFKGQTVNNGLRYALREDGRIERREHGPDGQEKISIITLKDVEFTLPDYSIKPWEGGEDRRPDPGMKR